LLAEIKRVKGAHTDENITEAVISIIKGIVSFKRLRFFIRDNAIINNTAIRVILT
jgi:hypothetical protein